VLGNYPASQLYRPINLSIEGIMEESEIKGWELRQSCESLAENLLGL